MLLVALSLLFAVQTGPAPDLGADVHIYETTTAHNQFPDQCDQRLDRLYITEDVDLAIEVQFSRPLTDEEQGQVHWQVDAADGMLVSGSFEGQSNPALITTPLTGIPREATVRVSDQGVDIAPPRPLRVVTNAEYDAA